jgi:hypothetical protein
LFAGVYCCLGTRFVWFVVKLNRWLPLARSLQAHVLAGKLPGQCDARPTVGRRRFPSCTTTPRHVVVQRETQVASHEVEFARQTTLLLLLFCESAGWCRGMYVLRRARVSSCCGVRAILAPAIRSGTSEHTTISTARRPARSPSRHTSHSAHTARTLLRQGGLRSGDSSIVQAAGIGARGATLDYSGYVLVDDDGEWRKHAH